MRIGFLGTPEPAVPPLQALLEAPDIDVAVVVTNPDRPAGRGYELTPPPVKVAASAAGVPVWQPQRPIEIAEDLRGLGLDACAVVAYGAILPSAVLETTRHGFVNLHFSLLPAWRGAAPVVHSILAGDETTGVTCFVLDEGMDTGPVLVRVPTPVEPEETAGVLTRRLAELGAPALVEALRGLHAGTIEPQPQEHGQATYAPKVGSDDAVIDWDASAAHIDRHVRAFNPVPGAHTTFEGARLKIHLARPVSGSGPPGQVLRVDEDGPVVACGDQAVLLVEVQPAGKARMSGVAFANGYAPVGRRLGR